MRTIKAYLNEVESWIMKLDGDKGLIEEYKIHLETEYTDYVISRPKTRMEDNRVEDEFVYQLEPPRKIARSLIGEDFFLPDVGLLTSFIQWYQNKILLKRGGYEFTIFVLWFIPGILWGLSIFHYDILFHPLLIPIYSFFPPIQDLFDFILSIPSAFSFFLMVAEVDFEIYTPLDPFSFFPAEGVYSLTAIFVYISVISYINLQDSIKRTLSTILLSSFSLVTGIMSMSALFNFMHLAPTADPTRWIISNLIGYFFLLGAVISLGYLTSIVVFIYRQRVKKEFTSSYESLDTIIRDNKASFLLALVFAILVMSPKILTAFSHPTYFQIPELILIMLLFFGMIAFQFWAFPLRFAIKSVSFMLVILVIFLFSIGISLGATVSVVISLYMTYFYLKHMK